MGQTGQEKTKLYKKKLQSFLGSRKGVCVLGQTSLGGVLTNFYNQTYKLVLDQTHPPVQAALRRSAWGSSGSCYQCRFQKPTPWGSEPVSLGWGPSPIFTDPGQSSADTWSPTKQSLAPQPTWISQWGTQLQERQVFCKLLPPWPKSESES